MVRPFRIEFPGSLYPVMSYGVANPSSSRIDIKGVRVLYFQSSDFQVSTASAVEVEGIRQCRLFLVRGWPFSCRQDDVCALDRRRHGRVPDAAKRNLDLAERR
jgi:hypothetical protein